MDDSCRRSAARCSQNIRSNSAPDNRGKAKTIRGGTFGKMSYNRKNKIFHVLVAFNRESRVLVRMVHRILYNPVSDFWELTYRVVVETIKMKGKFKH